MVKAIAVNGSPRKDWNTYKLLERALEGARSAGAETDEIVNLYGLNFKGCASCFRCKLKEGGNPGKCALNDDLTDVLKQVTASGVLLIGSPIYLWDVTAGTRAFLERLVFSNFAYRAENNSEFRGKVNAGFIYDMGAPAEVMASWGFDFLFKGHMFFLSCLNGKTEYMISNDTYQFNDYSKYDAPVFDPALKAKVREEQFPKDLQRAFDFGAKLVQSQ
jgi:multimeric flavodoxin WrbA